MIFIFTAFNISSNVTLGQSGKCDSSYPDVCISPPPADLNCPDIVYEDFKFLPPDPHGFERMEMTLVVNHNYHLE
jgi:hypothetical protein